MNNVSPITINKAHRLTEAEVHAAAEELQEAGSKVSSIALYKHLGRGSLTTITNFLKSWRPGEEERSALPALVSLPDTLKVASEQLIIKVWSESQKLAESELQSQREALRQAEAMASEKIEEAQAFSEEQAKQIEDLKVQIEILREEADKAHKYFLVEEKALKTELDHAKKGETIFEQRFIETEKQLNKKIEENKELQGIIKAQETDKQLEIDTSRKEERRLEAEIKKLQINEAELNQRILNNEKDLKITEELKKDCIERYKYENKELSKQRDEALRKAAILEGNLEIWKSLQPGIKKEIKENSKKTEKPTYKQVDVKEIIK